MLKAENTSRKQLFNHGWQFCLGDSSFSQAQAVTLPHDAMLSEPRGIESRGAENLGWYSGGDYEYKKRFTLPEELGGKRLVLE